MSSGYCQIGGEAGTIANMTRGELVALFERAMSEKDIKPAAASKAAVGNHYLVRNMTKDGRITVPSFENLQSLCAVLGLEFYIGPPRRGAPQSLPTRGFASCSIQGWGPPRSNVTQSQVAAPVELTDPDAFWVVAAGTSMRPEGIEPADFALVSPALPPLPGDRVWVLDNKGLASLKRLTALDEQHVHLRGWLPPDDKGTQQSFTDDRVRDHLQHVHPVIAVYNARPGGKRRARFMPDPRTAEFPPGPGRDVPLSFRNPDALDVRLANALELPADADIDAAIAAIGRLKASAGDPDLAAGVDRAMAELAALQKAVKR